MNIHNIGAFMALLPFALALLYAVWYSIAHVFKRVLLAEGDNRKEMIAAGAAIVFIIWYAVAFTFLYY